jgi:hypothetical protein
MLEVHKANGRWFGRMGSGGDHGLARTDTDQHGRICGRPWESVSVHVRP